MTAKYFYNENPPHDAADPVDIAVVIVVIRNVYYGLNVKVNLAFVNCSRFSNGA